MERTIIETPRQADRRTEALSRVQEEMRKEGIGAWVALIDPNHPGQSKAERFFSKVDRTARLKYIAFIYPDRQPLAFVQQLERDKFNVFEGNGGTVVEWDKAKMKELLKGVRRIAIDWDPVHPFSAHSLCPQRFREFLVSKLDEVEFASSARLSKIVEELLPEMPPPEFKRVRRKHVRKDFPELMKQEGVDAWVTFISPVERSEAHDMFFMEATPPALGVIKKDGTAVVISTTERSPGEVAAWLASVIRKAAVIAMDLPKGGAFTKMPSVPASVYDFVKEATGVQVVSSDLLMLRACTEWDTGALKAHRKAARNLELIINESFNAIRAAVSEGKTIQELEVSRLIKQRFAELGMTSRSEPIVASGPNSALLHHKPVEGNTREIGRGDVVIIDICARMDAPESPYADITWVAFVGTREEVPEKVKRAFSAVTAARDSVLKEIERRIALGLPLVAAELDGPGRELIRRAGFPDYSRLHGTGHSLGFSDAHGIAQNISPLVQGELHPNVGYTIEPGIYLPREFGVRSEINFFYNGKSVQVTTVVQGELLFLL